MCLSCSCHLPSAPHDDSRHITALMLESAARAAGIDPVTAARNIVRTIEDLCLFESSPSMGLFKERSKSEYALTRVVKAAEEQRYTLGVAYPANKADVARAADGHRDFVSSAVLEKTAWRWMAQHRDINLFHSNGTSGHGQVVESYIYRGPDWEVPSPVDGKPYVIKANDWLLGSIWDELGWSAVKAGLVNGWSPEGGATRGVPTKEVLASLRS